MKRPVLLWLTIFIALANAGRRTDWIIAPDVSPDGVEYTTSAYWDYRNNLLYYLAPDAGKVYSLDPTTNETKNVEVDKGAVFIQPTEKPDCIVYGVKNQIKIVEWDGKGDKKGGDVLVTMNEVGPDAKILAGIVSIQGNLTFIVKGTKDDKDAWFIYTMKLDTPPLKLVVNAKDNNDHLDSLYWSCNNKYLYASSSKRGQTYELQYYQTIGYLLRRNIQIWANNYHPLGESKEDTDNHTYQIMNYSNNDKAEIFQLSGFFLINNYFVAPVKMLTSDAWGGEDLKTLFITSKKTSGDQGGGLFSCDSIGATGRPAFIATSSLNPDINYCETPKPDLVVPMTAEEIKEECKGILSGSISAQGSIGGGAGGQAGGEPGGQAEGSLSVDIQIDYEFCANFMAQFDWGIDGAGSIPEGGSLPGIPGGGSVPGVPGGGTGGVPGSPGGGSEDVPGIPGGGGLPGNPGGGSVPGLPGGGSGNVTGGFGGGSVDGPGLPEGGGENGPESPGGGSVPGFPGGGSASVPESPGGGSEDLPGLPGGGALPESPGGGSVPGLPGGGSASVPGSPGGGSVPGGPGGGGGNVPKIPGGGSGNVPGSPGGGGVSGSIGGGVSISGNAGGGIDYTGITPCYLMPTQPTAP